MAKLYLGNREIILAIVTKSSSNSIFPNILTIRRNYSSESEMTIQLNVSNNTFTVLGTGPESE